MHNVPPDSESHFKVLVVSTKFEGLTLIKVSLTDFLFNKYATKFVYT